MAAFERRGDVRGKLIGFRATDAEHAAVADLAKRLGLRGQSDVMRMAMEYFLAHCAEAKTPPKTSSRRKV